MILKKKLVFAYLSSKKDLLLADKYVFISGCLMNNELEALKKENEQLKKELSILRNENISNRPVSFKEKYAVRILDSLPDMLTVFNQNEVGIEVVSNEETNHVGISNKDFKGMYMREMVPPEAYQNIHSNMRQAVSTGAVSTAHHELDFNGEHHHYENRIFPLDEEYVWFMQISNL